MTIAEQRAILGIVEKYASNHRDFQKPSVIC